MSRPVETVDVSFLLQFDGQPLVLGKQQYITTAGDSLYLDLLRFYFSSVQLIGSRNNFIEPESYHLIDAEEPGSLSIELKNVPVEQYDSLSFYVGTDSLTNVSGAMGGDLDPTLGMYWAWNTGYINVKIEGRSDACKNRYHNFEFHLGGYLPPYQTVRRVVLPLKNFTVHENAGIQVAVDISAFFDEIRLETVNQVMIPGGLACGLADFFQGVFWVR